MLRDEPLPGQPRRGEGTCELGCCCRQRLEFLLNRPLPCPFQRLARCGCAGQGVTGARQKETQAINASLSALGDVVGAMAGGESHVPYRNSKLTHLLQRPLGSSDSKVTARHRPRDLIGC